MNPADRKKIFKIAHKGYGRGPKCFVYPCAAPIKVRDTYYTTQREKCEELADFFWQKSNAKKEQEKCEEGISLNAQNGTSWGGKETRRCTPEPVPQRAREVEVTKAIRGLATDKTPCIDAVPVKVYTVLPALKPIMPQTITLMVKTGNIPKPLMEVLLVPLEKPGKPQDECG